MSELVHAQQYRNVTEWIGRVPSEWKLCRLKHACKHITDGSHFSPESLDEGLPYVTVRDLKDGRIDIDNAAKISPDDFQLLVKNGCKPKIGDILFSKDGTIGKIARVETDGFVILSSLAILRPKMNIDSVYLSYFLESQMSLDQMKSYLAGAALRRITLDVINDFVVVVSPQSVQYEIASFLNRKTARIDQLIAKKEQQIALLQEKRSTLISRAVTKGLNSKAKMKDSGVVWLREIPAHWDVKKVKHVFKNLDYRRIPLSSEERSYMGKTYPYYGASGVIDAVENFIFDEPLLLVAEDGANLYSRSTPLAFIAEGKYWVNNHAHILRPVNGPIKYWECVMQAFDYTPLISGAAQPKLTAENLANIFLPCPPVSEQDAIVDFLNKVQDEINQVRTKVEKSVELLREYRTALISAAVTGKIDVREVTA